MQKKIVGEENATFKLLEASELIMARLREKFTERRKKAEECFCENNREKEIRRGRGQEIEERTRMRDIMIKIFLEDGRGARKKERRVKEIDRE